VTTPRRYAGESVFDTKICYQRQLPNLTLGKQFSLMYAFRVNSQKDRYSCTIVTLFSVLDVISTVVRAVAINPLNLQIVIWN